MHLPTVSSKSLQGRLSEKCIIVCYALLCLYEWKSEVLAERLEGCLLWGNQVTPSCPEGKLQSYHPVTKYHLPPV